jgi:branched-chain amino acid aminotransferase
MAGPSPMLEYAYFEGNIVPFTDAKISVGTHAVQYGTGAFAGIRGYLDQDGETINIFRLPEHAARLLNSARLLRATLPFTRETLARVIVDLVEKNAPAGDVYIRPFVYKSSVQLVPRLTQLEDELAVYMMRMGDYLDTESGIKAAVSSWHRLPDNAVPGRGKISGGYINSSLAKDEAMEKGADEAILLDQQGHVAEGSGANLFLVRDGALVTAPITGDILEGITRRTIIQFARDEGMPIEERDIDRSELYIVDEAFFCGTGVQVSPISTIDGRPVGDGKPGPLTMRLRQIFFDTVRGRHPDYAHFLTRVRAKVASPAD